MQLCKLTHQYGRPVPKAGQHCRKRLIYAQRTFVKYHSAVLVFQRFKPLFQVSGGARKKALKPELITRQAAHNGRYYRSRRTGQNLKWNIALNTCEYKPCARVGYTRHSGVAYISNRNAAYHFRSNFLSALSLIMIMAA